MSKQPTTSSPVVADGECGCGRTVQRTIDPDAYDGFALHVRCGACRQTVYCRAGSGDHDIGRRRDPDWVVDQREVVL